MRFSITATPINKEASIPIQYNEFLQAYIYSFFEENFPQLHDEGFKTGKRKFRHFTFSRIFSSDMKMEDNYFQIRKPITFYLSFYLESMQEIAVNFLLKNQYMRLGNEEFEIIQANAFEENILFRNDEIVETDIEALSPIVAYRTIEKEGRKYTNYFKPTDSEFTKIIKNNLIRKMESLGIIETDDPFFFCPILFSVPKNESVLNYKGTIIKGYTGRYHIKCSKNAFSVLYHSGIGSKNSQGFGMFSIFE